MGSMGLPKLSLPECSCTVCLSRCVYLCHSEANTALHFQPLVRTALDVVDGKRLDIIYGSGTPQRSHHIPAALLCTP